MTYFLVGLITIYFFKSIYDLKELVDVNKALKKIASNLKEKKKNLEDRLEETLEKNIEKEKSIWMKEFIEEQVELDLDNQIINELNKKYLKNLKKKNYLHVDSKKYFNEETILYNNFNLDKISQKGPAFVGMGLLGTFIGLANALLKLNTGNTTEQIGLIDNILPSMSTAFFTSICGISASLIYGRCEKKVLGEITINISQITTNLNEIFLEREDIGKVLEKIEFSLNNLTQGLSKNLGVSVAESIGENTKSLFKGFNKEINNLGTDISSKVGVVFNQIFNKEFINDFKEIHESLKKINQTLAKTNKSTETVLAAIPTYTDSFENLNKTSLNIMKKSEETARNYNKFVSEVQKMEGVLEKLNGFKVEVLELIACSNSNIVENTNNVKKLSEETFEKYGQIGEEIKNILISSEKGTKQLLENSDTILQNFKISQNALRENIKGLNDIISLNKDVISEEYKKMGENQNSLAKKTKEALVNYDKVISKLNNEIMSIVSNIKDMSRK